MHETPDDAWLENEYTREENERLDEPIPVDEPTGDFGRSIDDDDD